MVQVTLTRRRVGAVLSNHASFVVAHHHARRETPVASRPERNLKRDLVGDTPAAEAGASRAAARQSELLAEKQRRHERQNEAARYARDAVRKAASGERSIHPALIPGISVENTDAGFKTNKAVFAVALAASLAVLLWAIVAPDNLSAVGGSMREWVVVNFGWMFSALMICALVFLLAVGLGPTGKIRLGADDSEPEFSTFAWISMLFAAGLGIGLIFYGPMEPLSHFMAPPPFVDAEPGTPDAVFPAMDSAYLHQATLPWAVYALVGGSLAYASFRRGRLPLISSLFEPVFTDSNNRVMGKIIDIFAVLVTLFGTATSLGIGALQIKTGTSIVTGRPLEGNGVVVVIISILTVLFIFSAMSGVKRGIRILSNTNMALVIGLSIFVLLTGPTLFILDLLPASLLQFIDNFNTMMSANPSQGPAEQEFVVAYTMLFWAWWISWSPFVGMFIAKISKGRTLRQFVVVVLTVPSGLSVAWYAIFGGTAIWMHMNGQEITVEGAGENVMFDLLSHLPLSGLMSVLMLVAIVVFFNTAADSATNVMGSMSQNGRPKPATPVVIIWGAALGLISLFLLLAGGQDALSGLQNIMVSCSLPFAIILIGIMIAWAQDLRQDPLIIRRKYAAAAIEEGVKRGLDEHDGHFIFGAEQVPEGQGASAAVDDDDPNLHEWYTESASEEFRAERIAEREAAKLEREEFEEQLAQEEAAAEQEADIADDAHLVEEYWTEKVAGSEDEEQPRA